MGLIKEPTKDVVKSTKVSPGDIVQCVKSHSCGYTEGKTYEVYLNDKGWKCLKADDGLEDLWSMLISEFRK